MTVFKCSFHNEDIFCYTFQILTLFWSIVGGGGGCQIANFWGKKHSFNYYNRVT